jgi:hypothetical protein
MPLLCEDEKQSPKWKQSVAQIVSKRVARSASQQNSRTHAAIHSSWPENQFIESLTKRLGFVVKRNLSIIRFHSLAEPARGTLPFDIIVTLRAAQRQV